MAPLLRGTRLLRHQLVPSPKPQTLILLLLRRPFHLPSHGVLPFLLFRRHLSAPGRPSLAEFRELLARAEREKKRWGYVRRLAGEEEEEEEVGIEVAVERFERLAEGWGGGTVGEESAKEAWEGGGVWGSERLDLDGVLERYRMLLEGCAKADTSDDVHKWMVTIDKFEEKYLSVILRCRNGQRMLDKLNVVSKEERPIVIKKIAHMIELNQWKDHCASDGIIKTKDTELEERKAFFDALKNIEFSSKLHSSNPFCTNGSHRENNRGQKTGDDVELLQKLYVIDKMVEEKLAGRQHIHIPCEKGDRKVGNEAVTSERTVEQPKSCFFNYKGFDVKLVDIDRKYGGSKAEKMVKYNVLVACGNYNGVVGFAKAQAPDFQTALNKAYEACFQNLHFVRRHEDRTILHPVQAEFEKTKIYIWPAPVCKGMKASRSVETVLRLAGFLDLRAKVIGFKTPYNSLSALFRALNASRLPEYDSEIRNTN